MLLAAESTLLTMRGGEGAVALRLAVVGVSWGAAYVAGRFVAESMVPALAVALRLLIASACLGTILLALPSTDRTVARSDLAGVLFLGLVGVLGFNLLFFFGLESTGAVNGTLIGATVPVATALLAVFVLGERLRAAQWAGVVLSFAGVIVVVSDGSIASLLALESNPGDLLIVAAVACWAVYTVAGRGLIRRYRPVTLTAYTFFMATAVALPLAAGEAAISGGVAFPGSWAVWAALFFLATVSVLGFVWWNEGVAVFGPTRTAVFNNLVPITGIVLGSLLLGETVTVVHLAGAALVVAGVLLTVRGDA